MQKELTQYKVLELLAKLCEYKGLHYEIGEIKDGRIITIINIRIDEINLTKDPLE